VVLIFTELAKVPNTWVDGGIKVFTSLFGGSLLVYTEKVRTVLLKFASFTWNQVLQVVLLAALILVRLPIVSLQPVLPAEAVLFVDNKPYTPDLRVSLSQHNIAIFPETDYDQRPDDHARHITLSATQVRGHIFGGLRPRWGLLYPVRVVVPEEYTRGCWLEVASLDEQSLDDVPQWRFLRDYSPSFENGKILLKLEAKDAKFRLPPGCYQFTAKLKKDGSGKAYQQAIGPDEQGNNVVIKDPFEKCK
jgi:hypothetical protein